MPMPRDEFFTREDFERAGRKTLVSDGNCGTCIDGPLPTALPSLLQMAAWTFGRAVVTFGLFCRLFPNRARKQELETLVGMARIDRR